MNKQHNININALFEDFLTDRILKGCSQKTLVSYRLAYAHFIRNNGELSKEGWKNYLFNLVNSNLTTASKNHYITHLRAFFYYAMNEGYITNFKIHLLRGQESQCKAYTQYEINALLKIDLKHCTYVEHRCYAIICLILATGLRANTFLNIYKEDIKGEYLTIREQKNKKTTTIPLSIQIQKVLRNFINSWDSNSRYLFNDNKDNQLSMSALRLSLEDYFKARGVKYHGVHSLRHTFAKLFILNGGNAFQLQKMLGHSTLTMTKRYVYLFAEEIKEAIQSVTPLDNIMTTKKRG